MNPNGIPSFSPGLSAQRATLGHPSKPFSNPERVEAKRGDDDATPLGLMIDLMRIPRVARASQPWAERPYPVGVNSIPAASPEKQKPLERLVDRILAAKAREGSTGIPACESDSVDPQTGMSVSQMEREIDELVYALYALTPEEIQLVEGAAK